MRILVPEEIEKLIDIFLPYLFFDEYQEEWKLSSDAPADVVDARKKYVDWFYSHKYEQ